MATLAEDLFLLASHGATGKTLIPAAHLDLGLGGAHLLDLELRQRIGLVDSHVTVTDSTPTGQRSLDAALAAVAGESRVHEPVYWVRHLARGARTGVLDDLVAAGVLQVEGHRVLGLFPVQHVHEVDARLEHELVDDLHAAVVLDRAPSREIAALVSLLLAVGLDRHLFPRADRRAIRHRMDQVAYGEWVRAAVQQAILALNASLGIPVPPEGATEGTR